MKRLIATVVRTGALASGARTKDKAHQVAIHVDRHDLQGMNTARNNVAKAVKVLIELHKQNDAYVRT